MSIDADRLLKRLDTLGAIGAEEGAGRTRLALTAEDRKGRDTVVSWMQEAGAEVHVDAIGNIHGVLRGESDQPAVMSGSHIDTVRRAGALDGCYGVIAAIEVLEALRRGGNRPRRSFVVTAFTNEEGVRYMPDLLGSRVMTKEISLDEALTLLSNDGQRFGEELERIGYAGRDVPWQFLPGAFVELHIEQGPVLDASNFAIGVVEGVQGYSWWNVSVTGRANHAGTTPMHLRQDAGAVSMALVHELTRRSVKDGLPKVLTTGTFKLEPGSINVVPGRATFTLDMRDPDDRNLARAEAALAEAIGAVRAAGYSVTAERMSQNPAIRFSPRICDCIEQVAANHSLRTHRLVSGASHDAQMMARVCPTAMIFVPSRQGLSHNPAEFTEPDQLVAGAQVLLGTVRQLIESPHLSTTLELTA